jgi:hypothetical protein
VKIALKDGKALPIKFRIEAGAVIRAEQKNPC